MEVLEGMRRRGISSSQHRQQVPLPVQPDPNPGSARNAGACSANGVLHAVTKPSSRLRQPWGRNSQPTASGRDAGAIRDRLSSDMKRETGRLAAKAKSKWLGNIRARGLEPGS